MAVGKCNIAKVVKIFIHPLGIVKQRKTLTGVKQQRSILPFNQGTEPVLSQCTGDRADCIFAQDGYSVVQTFPPSSNVISMCVLPAPRSRQAPRPATAVTP